MASYFSGGGGRDGIGLIWASKVRMAHMMETAIVIDAA